MYSTKPSFVYGFHGIDEDVAYQVLNNYSELKQSDNHFDWLGQGTYFWENNLSRAKKYALEDSQRKDSKIKKPFVLGAAIDLGHCFDLLQQDNLDFLQYAYQDLINTLNVENKLIPANTGFTVSDFDFKKRKLDCAVIRWAHRLAARNGKSFDTVRAAFWEGEALYPNAGFKSQNHIQIAVLNPDCIKGIFLPRNKNT